METYTLREGWSQGGYINYQGMVVTGWIHKLSRKGAHRVDTYTVREGWSQGGYRNCQGMVVTGWIHKLSGQGGHINCQGNKMI